MPGQRSSAFSILLVCTGNICRSALAERLGRAYVDALLGDAGSSIRLSSAGTRAVVGSEMHPDTALVLRGFGGDPAGHVARQLDEQIASSSDLTLTMTRQHRRDALSFAPRALARTFTLREAADLLRQLGTVDLPGGDLAERARALVAELASVRSRRDGRQDDVPDPIGRSLEVQQEVADMIAEALLPLLGRISEAPP